jgi:Domain of unknown function (DUF1996)
MLTRTSQIAQGKPTVRCLSSTVNEAGGRDVKGLLLIAAGAAVVAVVGSSALAGTRGANASGQEITRADLRGVNFVENCRFSHRAPDDPIVFPGQSGASHDHSFVGNRTTSAFSTYESLRAGATTCMRRADTAAYWVPTLYQETSEVLPVGATIYYRRGTLEEVQTFPNGFRMIAGDSKATSAQGFRVTYWNCGIAGGVPPSSTVPACSQVRGSFLRLHIRFPNCWDGRHLDSADHRSHVAYSLRGGCPSTHPVELPAIELIYRYPTLGGEGFSLASGGQLSAHGDFLNAWKPSELRHLVEGCLNALVHCGRL